MTVDVHALVPAHRISSQVYKNCTFESQLGFKRALVRTQKPSANSGKWI